MKNRTIWVEHLINIIHPVMSSLAAGTLTQHMPIEISIKFEDEGDKIRRCTYLEALGRTLCGLSAWFNAKNIYDEEFKLQEYYKDLTLKGLENAFDCNSPDFLFHKENGAYTNQILVDASFLAFALIRSKQSIWSHLDKTTQNNIIKYFKETRAIAPHFNNWILFSGMIEAFFYSVGEDYDLMRIDYGIKQMEQWYVGDGIYKDGNHFHNDYYNSYVIQPFLIEIISIFKDVYRDFELYYPNILKRAKRFAKVQEMTVNTDGTFPAIGRSITYRCGAFHHLAYCAENKILPDDVSEGSARRALIKVIERCLDAPNTFDKDGWLRIGLHGNQPALGEDYISTGSLYLCTFAFLPLGLDGNDSFWTCEDELFSMEKIWSGENVLADHSL